MRIVLLALVIVGVVLALSLSYLFLYLLVPISLAVGLVVVRRNSPRRAVLTGALATFCIIFLVGLPIFAMKVLSGDFNSEDLTGSERFVVALILLLIIAATTAVVGGLISALVSHTFVRPAHGDQV